jgi:AcrR family transcriptional regulator
MASRRQETREERREQILRGALEVFSTRGFLQATNKDVAEAAGINSPGLIYHYFASKEDLLRAVIEQYGPPMQLVAHAEALMAMPPEEGLAQFGRAYLALMEHEPMSACMRLLIGEALRSAEFARLLGEIGPLRIFHLLEEYLRRQMDAGRLQRLEPAIAARCFIGPLVAYVLGRVILRLPDDPAVSGDALVAATVRIFLNGLQP